MDIETLLGRLNPKTAEAFRVASEATNEVTETPSLGVNLAIGGLPQGRQTLLWGNKSAGKTAFALAAAANAQKQGRGVAWIDAEKNFDPTWARRLGADPDQIGLSRITSIADMADAGSELIKAGFEFVVVDSISVLLPQSYFDTKTEEMKGLAGTGQIGTYAKNMGTAVNMLNRINQDTALVLISQVRNSINTYGAAIGPMGGFGVEHMNSTVIKFWTNPKNPKLKKRPLGSSGLLLEKPVGVEVTWTVNKARGPGMNATGKYDFYHDGDQVGVDLAGEVLDYGTLYGKVKKSGNWYYLADEKFNGYDKAVEFLQQNNDVLEKVYGEILEESVR